MKIKINNIRLLYSLALLLGISLFNSCSKKAPEPVIAKAGNTTIPLSEFRDRFELTPHIMHTADKDRNVRNVLASLLGEKLLVEEAYKQGLQKQEKFITFAEQMKKEAIVEKLFDKEIASKIEISPEEVKQGYIRSQIKLELKVISFDDEQQALEAKKQIDAGKSLSRVKREFQTDTFISTDSVLTVHMKWGDSHPKLEEAAYSLKLNEVSPPVLADGRYYIIKLVNRSSAVFLTEGDFINKAPSIRKIIKRRKRSEMLSRYMRSVMAKKTMRVPHKMFDLVATELEKLYGLEDTLSHPRKIPDDLAADSLDMGDFADHLDDTFARFNDGSTWTVAEFIKKLSVGPYSLNKDSKQALRNSLRRIIRRMAEFETLAKKGHDLGLDKTYYVQYQTKMWGDSYLGQLMRQKIIDTVTVSDAEVKYYYEKHKNDYSGPELVNLHEILVDDKQLAYQILRRIKKGEDMRTLARKYNKRQISIKRDGVMGYFKTSVLGKIGEVARGLQIGEVAGPVKTEQNQYSVFKLLDKREAGPLPLDEVWREVKRDALSEKRTRTIDEHLTKLADKYRITINKAVLDTLTTYDLNILVWKRHFANRTAAPVVTPLYKSHRWQNKIDEIYP